MTLLGPDGHPYEASHVRKRTYFDPMHARQISQSYKKAKPPKTGPVFGDWAGRDMQYASLPGGGAMLFDLSLLTLSDFRQMRWHPQVNISLSILNFMFHQIEWQISPVDSNDSAGKKIAAACEENLRFIWSQLVGAINQAFWAGFGPTVIEWENNPKTGFIEMTRFKDLVPEECEVNWREVDGYAPPGRMKPKFRVYDGIIQGGGAQGWPIPTDNSFWYPLLMENGDYYGRKLLKPAFTPWYFSTLVHLFANRYYERFGEPTPIGRAPYDADVELADGSVVTGRQAMEDIMDNLRSRGVVTLPSDRDPATKEFDYSLEYLESQMRGVDFDRYLGRLDEEISMGMFTPILLFRSGDVGSNSLGVQHTQCVHPDTPVLCADLVWRKAGDLEVGQEIVAFDESPVNGSRSYRAATIEANQPGVKPSVTVATDVGIPITMSVDHPCLVVGDDGEVAWKDAGDLVPGDCLAHIGRPWGGEDEDSADEGALPLYDAMRSASSQSPASPASGLLWDCVPLAYGHSVGLAAVVSVTWAGDSPVASIQTSAGTFITGGYLTHNTFLWMLNGIYGDIKYYIDRYILRRWKAINYSPNAPDIEWDFRKMGRESKETIRAIINSLISGGRAMVDLDELGQALGMTVKEIRQTQDDPASDRPGRGLPSGVDDRIRDDRPDAGQTVGHDSEPRATGKQVSLRVASQVKSAWRKGAFDKDFEPSLGYERRMTESLVASGLRRDEAEAKSKQFFDRISCAISDIAALGMDNFSGPSDVMSLVDRHIDLSISEMVP